MASSTVIVSHKFLTQPDDDLAVFLNNKKYENVLHIRHSFSNAPDRCSRYTWYKNGAVHKEGESGDYKKFPEPLIYAKEFFFTLKWIFASKIVWDTYVGMDGLCAAFGNVLRSFGRVKRTIYWAIDFVPENRFKAKLKNKIYHWINTAGCKRSDEMWDLSPRMAEAREKFLGIRATDYKKHRVVPYGVWTERIKKYGYDECEQNMVVFMGHLLEKQGVQLVIAAMPELIKQMPGFRFKIIGAGPYKQTLIELAERLGVLSHCDFLGKIDDIRKLEDEVARSCVAVAPYIKKLDTWTYYADPGKVKTYLACGVPLLLTDIPWNAKEIEYGKCGMIINDDATDIKDKISSLVNKKMNQEFRDNAIHYAAMFDYKNIFNTINL